MPLFLWHTHRHAFRWCHVWTGRAVFMHICMYGHGHRHSMQHKCRWVQVHIICMLGHILVQVGRCSSAFWSTFTCVLVHIHIHAGPHSHACWPTFTCVLAHIHMHAGPNSRAWRHTFMCVKVHIHVGEGTDSCAYLTCTWLQAHVYVIHGDQAHLDVRSAHIPVRVFLYCYQFVLNIE